MFTPSEPDKVKRAADWVELQVEASGATSAKDENEIEIGATLDASKLFTVSFGSIRCELRSRHADRLIASLSRSTRKRCNA